MHAYATDSNERFTVPALLVVLAILSALGLTKVVEFFRLHDKLWWLDLPAVWGFYGLYWKVFDRYLWKLRVVRRLRLVRVPNLAGVWTGHGISSFQNEQGELTRYEARLVIHQGWTRCFVRLEANDSRSESVIGALMVGDGQPATLSYEYRNEPRAHADKTMHPHRGMARLEMVSVDQLEGEYYTGRDRQRYGTLHLRKVDAPRLMG
jgi:hypothetical protein